MSRCDECMVIGSRECCKCMRELETQVRDLNAQWQAMVSRIFGICALLGVDPTCEEPETCEQVIERWARELEEAEARLAAVMGVLEKECPEQAPVSPLGFPRHPKQTLLCNACGEARNENGPDALEWHKPDCSWRITREAIADTPPAAARLRAIVRAAEAETDAEEKEKIAEAKTHHERGSKIGRQWCEEWAETARILKIRQRARRKAVRIPKGE